MYIDKDGKRFNTQANIEYDGRVFPGNILEFPDVVEELGLVEIQDPQPPADYHEDLYFRAQSDFEPYVIYTRKPVEQIMLVMQSKFERALDRHLDHVAQQHRYDSRITFALRAGYPGPFQAEGLAFALWMDNCNVISYKLMIDVRDGKAPIPANEEAFLSILPPFELNK